MPRIITKQRVWAHRPRGGRFVAARTIRQSFCGTTTASRGSGKMRSVSTVAPDRESVLETLRSSNRFVIQQVLRPLANEYRISAAPAGSEEGQPLLFVKQKKMKIKEDIRFRLDPDAEDFLFMIKSKSVFEFRGRHEILDSAGAPIGMLEKVFAKSLLRSHWVVRGAGGEELFEAHEASWPIAIIRRLGEVGPDWVSLLQWLPFNFVLKHGGAEAATYKRVLGKFRDRYVLELGPELAGIDRRLVLAFAVALDALQDR
jgi:uncharacterized protein YxjI